MSDDIDGAESAGAGRVTAADAEGQTPADRGAWNSRFGFIMAAVGSAVGLGNMWRFPYLTAEHGGAAFVILYVGMLVLLGIPIMLAEFALGRGTGLSSIGAFKRSGGKRWVPFGYLFVVTGITILAFYSVIAGWVSRYAIAAIFSGFPSDPSAHFGSMASGLPAMGFHLAFMAMVIVIVMGGVEKGIERASVLMMPLLFVLIAGLAVWAATLSGSGAGYSFYLAPNVSELLNPSTIAAAAGQAFFSLSLGMGALLTFASYLSRDSSLPREGGTIATADFGVAFLAGLVIFPVIFAFGLQDAVGESTVGALFIALPEGFASLGVAGRVVGAVFFIALLIAAVTSAISLLEVVVSALIDEWDVQRKPASIGAGIFVALVGLWPAADTNALGVMDAVTGNIFLPLGALGLALYVGWVYKNPIDEVAMGAAPGVRRWLKGWLWLLRFLAPVLLVAILAMGIGGVREAIAELIGG